MKKLALLITLLIANIAILNAQKPHLKNLQNYDLKRWHFGFSVGLNSMGFKVERNEEFMSQTNIYGIESLRHTGFVLGPLSNLRICEYLDLRMMFNLSFSQRDLIYHLITEEKHSTHTMKISSTMLEFPIQLKYKAERMTNFSPYLIAGLNPKYDLGSNKEPTQDELPKIQLEKIDPCAEFGCGFDFYLQYFKLAFEIKYSMGFLNVAKFDNTEYTNVLKALRSNCLMFTLHFE